VDNILLDSSVRTLYLTRHETLLSGARRGAPRSYLPVSPTLQVVVCGLWCYYRDSTPLTSPTFNERVGRLITDVSISILLELRRMTYVGISFRAFQGHGVRLTYHAARPFPAPH